MSIGILDILFGCTFFVFFEMDSNPSLSIIPLSAEIYEIFKPLPSSNPVSISKIFVSRVNGFYFQKRMYELADALLIED